MDKNYSYVMKNSDAIKHTITQLWDEFGVKALVIAGLILAVFLGGGVYRISQGNSFWGEPESQTKRESRLRQCADVYYEPAPSYAERDGDGNAGICSGFNKAEVDDMRIKLGL